jgi:hypothetical protein
VARHPKQRRTRSDRLRRCRTPWSFQPCRSPSRSRGLSRSSNTARSRASISQRDVAVLSFGGAHVGARGAALRAGSLAPRFMPCPPLR